ncbi:MAG: DUF3333 domain-containing protein, partial [Gammaproteobacteria bacterium]|nr:DUF3333 domain-containing protein [Gammaproteobacteria bacterium]
MSRKERVNNSATIRASLRKRYARERRFRLFGISSIVVSFLFLLLLLTNITLNGLPAFQQSHIKLDVTLDERLLGVSVASPSDALYAAPYSRVIRQSLKMMFPGVKGRKQKRALKKLVSSSAAYQLRDQVVEEPHLIGTTQSLWFLAKDDVDLFMKGEIDRTLPESERRLKDFQLVWIDQLVTEERLEKRFNTTFFTAGDSREPEQAGIRGAITGSLLTMLVTIMLSFPIGVAAAIYLEEFAPKENRWVDWIEININNLAAVPSIIFGLLGLAIFINFFH